MENTLKKSSAENFLRVFGGFCGRKTCLRGARASRAPPFVVAVDVIVSVVSVSAVCDHVDQGDQVVPAHQVDDIDEAHQVDPVHQVDHQR